MALVSVIIPVYNAEAYLRDCVTSVLAQSWRKLEIILVNDGSSDRSWSIIQEFKDPRIRAIDQPNMGASAARNQGLNLAQGNYIQFLDADDLLSQDKILLQMNRLQKNGADCIASCAWGRFIGDPQNARFIPDALWQDLNPIEFLVQKYNLHTMLQPGAWLSPRNVIEVSGNWNESLSLNDDGEYFSRVVLRAKKILFCPEAKVYYRSANISSLASQRSRRHLESLTHSIELCAEQLLAQEESPRTLQAVVNLYQELIYTLYPQQKEKVQMLERKVKALGVKPTRPLPGGPARQKLAQWIGWKNAAHLLQYLQQIKRK